MSLAPVVLWQSFLSQSRRFVAKEDPEGEAGIESSLSQRQEKRIKYRDAALAALYRLLSTERSLRQASRSVACVVVVCTGLRRLSRPFRALETNCRASACFGDPAHAARSEHLGVQNLSCPVWMGK